MVVMLGEHFPLLKAPTMISVEQEKFESIERILSREDVYSTDSCMGRFGWYIVSMRDVLTSHRQLINKVILGLVLIGYFAYFVAALVVNFYRARWLLILTSFVAVVWLYSVVRNRYGDVIYLFCNVGCTPASSYVTGHQSVFKWVAVTAVLICIVLFVGLIVQPEPSQLISVLGFVVILFFLFLFSKHPSKVNFRPVFWGLGLQFLLAVFVLRTSFGLQVFKAIGDEVQTFLNYTEKGAEFVFGEDYRNVLPQNNIIFSVLPVIVFFSSVVSTLYYLGVMQMLITKLGWLMEVTMGTSPTESLTAAANIFIGQTEAPLLVRPFIGVMTLSELHAMLTCGFATVAGSVLAAYINMGVSPLHLICASVMNAPVALAVSKLVYPETSSTKLADTIHIESGEESNIIEAAAAGASASISLAANIVVNLIAFLAILAFVDGALSWFGNLVELPDLSFALLSSYLFMPLAFLLGVEWSECGMVAELLGTKLFLNEFVAFKKLGEYIHNRETGYLPSMSIRSEIISTYALCGFANLTSIGIQLGGIGPMAPHRRGDLAALSLSALFSAFMVNALTACVAGLLTPLSTVAVEIMNATEGIK